MSEFFKRTWAEIDLNAIENNFKNIKKLINKNTKILCVLKADAYGHGAEFLVKEYERLGADWFGVSNLNEGIQLRNSGATKPILIFGYTNPNAAALLNKYNISQAVFSYEYAQELQKACQTSGVNVNIHLKIDSGMSRIGFLAHTKDERETSVKEISKINQMDELNIEGIFTHFAVADDITHNKTYTEKQFANFSNMISELENLNIKLPLKHCCNSGGIINFPHMQLNMVRAGIILYGIHPSNETRGKIDLQPAMQLKAVVSQVKSVPAGTSVSYGITFTSPKEMKIASVTIGYADGYSLKFSNNSEMLVHCKRAKIVGRVCMDQLMLDVTDIPNVKEGDEVIVFGHSGAEELSADELAQKIGTISYEIICLVGKRVPRIYLKNGELVGKISYI